MLRDSPVAPPVVELGRLAGWSPLPLSVRDARRAAGPLREQLAKVPTPRRERGTGAAVVELRDVSARYGDIVALRAIDLTVARGETVALMGRNGAGKSTLLSLVAGLLRPARGTVSVAGGPTHGRAAAEVVRRIGLVPHNPGDLLLTSRVGDECTQSDRDAAASAGTTRNLLDAFSPGIADDTHPNDLSEGQRLALALAVVVASAPAVVALDEPTRGLDYGAKHRLVATLHELSSTGHAVLLATHDVELAAELADRIVVLADGEVVTDDAADVVAVSSPLFAPQVAKVLAPLPLLTVADVTRELAG
jgi:energy-coupling factor transport system ATP-binding protein